MKPRNLEDIKRRLDAMFNDMGRREESLPEPEGERGAPETKECVHCKGKGKREYKPLLNPEQFQLLVSEWDRQLDAIWNEWYEGPGCALKELCDLAEKNPDKQEEMESIIMKLWDMFDMTSATSNNFYDMYGQDQ